VLVIIKRQIRQDITLVVVHQLAQLYTNQKESHGKAIKYLGRCLHGTKDMGPIMKTKLPVSLTFYSHADLCRTWEKQNELNNTNTTGSRRGFQVFFAKVPLFCKLKIQSTILNELVSCNQKQQALSNHSHTLSMKSK
jgi:hypothetical protein